MMMMVNHIRASNHDVQQVTELLGSGEAQRGFGHAPEL